MIVAMRLAEEKAKKDTIQEMPQAHPVPKSMCPKCKKVPNRYFHVKNCRG
jgi:hypothetical protein